MVTKIKFDRFAAMMLVMVVISASLFFYAENPNYFQRDNWSFSSQKVSVGLTVVEQPHSYHKQTSAVVPPGK